MSDTHSVVLNLPDNSTGALPDPNKAPVEIDGLALDFVKSVTVHAGNGERTLVTIALYADVTGKVSVGEEHLIKDVL